MNENYNKIMAYFALSNIFGYFLLEGYYIPCLIGIWLYYSYNNEQKSEYAFYEKYFNNFIYFFIGAVLCEVIGTMLLPLFVNILRMRIFYRYIGLKNKGE